MEELLRRIALTYQELERSKDWLESKGDTMSSELEATRYRELAKEASWLFNNTPVPYAD